MAGMINILRYLDFLPNTSKFYKKSLPFLFVLREFIKILINPLLHARIYPNYKVYSDSLEYKRAFREYSRQIYKKWTEKGSLSYRQCPLCDSVKHIPYLQTPEGISYSQCNACNFVYLNPVPSEKEYLEIYETGYNGLIEKKEKKKEKNSISDSKVITNYDGLEIIKKYKTTGRFLDYGCGSGWALSLAKKYYDVFGIDIDEKQLARAKETTGLSSRIQKIDIGEEDSISHLYGSFDIVHTYQNIEHLLSPRRYLREFNKLLKTGGILYISCPNIDSFAFECLKELNSMACISHVSMFSPKTISNVLKLEGFEILEVGTYSRDISVYEFIMYNVNPNPILFEHRNFYTHYPFVTYLLGLPLWGAIEAYFFLQLLKRKEKFGNYLYCVAKKI